MFKKSRISAEVELVKARYIIFEIARYIKIVIYSSKVNYHFPQFTAHFKSWLYDF